MNDFWSVLNLMAFFWIIYKLKFIILMYPLLLNICNLYRSIELYPLFLTLASAKLYNKYIMSYKPHKFGATGAYFYNLSTIMYLYNQVTYDLGSF